MFFFFASFIATLAAPIFIPSFRLFFFAPCLVLMLYKKELVVYLWMAFLAGLILDLLTAGNRMGILALNYTLTAFFISQFKPYFFADRLSTLPILTFLFSASSACFQLLLEAIFSGEIAISIAYITWDMFLIPILDALFALVISSVKELKWA